MNDTDIINKVIGKYNKLEKYDFSIGKEEDDIIENGITLFEYCYALGEIISEEHPILFPRVKNTTNPCGFEIVALICGVTLGREDEIKKHLNNATPEFLVDLKKEICDSIMVVENILKDWIVAKMENTIFLIVRI